MLIASSRGSWCWMRLQRGGPPASTAPSSHTATIMKPTIIKFMVNLPNYPSILLHQIGYQVGGHIPYIQLSILNILPYTWNRNGVLDFMDYFIQFTIKFKKLDVWVQAISREYSLGCRQGAEGASLRALSEAIQQDSLRQCQQQSHINFVSLQSMSMDPTEDISCVFQGLCGKGAIFVSGFSGASSPFALGRLNIQSVVSVARSGYLTERAHLQAYLYIPAEDVSGYPISDHFQTACAFLDKHRRSGNVLVHCMQGISRSAAIVAAYLLHKYRYPLPEVLAMLRRKRQKIHPNEGFMQQLSKYCHKIGVQTDFHKHRIGHGRCSSNLGVHKREDEKEAVKGWEEEEQTNVSKSVEKQKEEQKAISEKIERLRKQVMRAGKCRSRGNKIAWGGLQSSHSESLRNAQRGEGGKNRSLQLE